MFILRTIDGSGHEHNQSLGESYNITFKEQHPDYFNKDADFKSWDELYPGELYGIIVCFGGSKSIPLWKKQQNYVMTETGKTFANISFK